MNSEYSRSIINQKNKIININILLSPIIKIIKQRVYDHFFFSKYEKNISKVISQLKKYSR